jgi:hypothetical protein
MPHINGRAEARQRLLDDFDGAVDAGAEAAWIGENDVHVVRLAGMGNYYDDC